MIALPTHLLHYRFRRLLNLYHSFLLFYCSKSNHLCKMVVQREDGLVVNPSSQAIFKTCIAGFKFQLSIFNSKQAGKQTLWNTEFPCAHLLVFSYFLKTMDVYTITWITVLLEQPVFKLATICIFFCDVSCRVKFKVFQMCCSASLDFSRVFSASFIVPEVL